VSPHTVEIMAGGCRVTSHERQFDEGGMSTIPDHRPYAHHAYVSWTHQALWEFAEYIGPATVSFILAIAFNRHPQELLRIGLGLKKLAAQYSPERLEKGCERVIRINALSFSSVESILKRGLDRGMALSLVNCEWITAHHHLLITGPIGIGKTYLANAFVYQACRLGYTVFNE